MEEIIKELIAKSEIKLAECALDFERYLGNSVGWHNRLIAITGARGTGKTTLILQQAKKQNLLPNQLLYISLDDVLLRSVRLIDIASWFYKNGGTLLLLDEVHKYPQWSLEIKNIYDTYSKLKIIFTGSSILEIQKGEADLSRRALVYNLHNLSLREFTELKDGIKLPLCTLDEIIKNHTIIARDINTTLRPIMYYNEYLKYGCFPYFKEDIASYGQRLISTINLVIETDVPAVVPVDYASIVKMKQLTGIIAESVPFKPNITKLSERLSTKRDTLLRYLHTLDKARVLCLLNNSSDGIGILTKPEKIYLNNPNMLFALGSKNANVGTLRETFFINQLQQNNSVNYTEKGDFLVNNKFVFEVGGANKTTKQIAGIKNSFIAMDNIEFGVKNTIPLWMFGLMY